MERPMVAIHSSSSIHSDSNVGSEIIPTDMPLVTDACVTEDRLTFEMECIWSR
jgi:hypothetical protein